MAEERDALVSRVAQCSVYRSPDDGRSKGAVWIALEGDGGAGDFIIWDSGEGEIGAVFGPDSERWNESLEALTETGVRRALAVLVDRVARPE